MMGDFDELGLLSLLQSPILSSCSRRHQCTVETSCVERFAHSALVLLVLLATRPSNKLCPGRWQQPVGYVSQCQSVAKPSYIEVHRVFYSAGVLLAPGSGPSHYQALSSLTAFLAPKLALNVARPFLFPLQSCNAAYIETRQAGLRRCSNSCHILQRLGVQGGGPADLCKQLRNPASKIHRKSRDVSQIM